MPVLSIGDKRLGAVLLERGYVSDESLQTAIGRHADVGGRLANILVNIGVISEQRIIRAIEESLGIPQALLTRIDISSDALAKVPADLANEVRAFPFGLDGVRLRVAFEDPLDALAIEEIEDASECLVEPYQALNIELQWALATHYPELGLEPPNELELDTGRRLGTLVLERGYATDHELDEAIREQERTGGLLGRILVERGVLTEEELAPLLAEQVGIPFLERLDDMPFDEGLADHLLRLDAIDFHAVPYKEEDENLVIAVADPRRMPDIEAVIKRPVTFVASTESSVMRRIEAMYADNKGRLGETLLVNRKLSRDQLRKALEEQKKLGHVKPLGEILVDLGYVGKADVEEAVSAQRSGGGRLEDTLVQSGKLSPDMLAKSLAMQLGYEFITEDNLTVDPYAVSLVPEATARRYNAMPIRLEGNTLIVAMKDPRHVFALDDIRLITGKELQPAVATEETLGRLISRFYRNGDDMDELAKAVLEEVGHQEQVVEDTSAIDDNALVKVVNNIIREAILNDISDIHIEPRPLEVQIRVRKDGTLREYMTMPKATASALAARIKIMGGLNIAERRVPQDGRVRFKDRSMEVDLRLSTLPTVYGEKSVMRILKKASNIPEIENLGFADYNFRRFSDVIQKPYGMFLITGPTGSGKSFTTFSILKRVAVPEVNVSTVEDPVEYEIPGINQTQINPKAGLDFARALRAFLRQDPDIIMVGEIRDQETAKISVEAALTGHLLIATLHTNDASGAVTRLTEMGIEPFNVSASLIGVLAQRLVRKVCKDCKVEYTPEPDVMRRLNMAEDQIAGKSLFRGVGCEKCNGTGYNGRYGIHELLIVDNDIEAAIVKEKSSFEIKDIASQNGMKTLRDDGIHKAFEGITTLEEVLARTSE
ncbi:MAG: Flp pilus assembly complex ATPase component TadA [Trueperaceae bacterium]|nr:MAG: Flp pilus assembly complex ATPase component TadA [Trueperaceae bacterium]